MATKKQKEIRPLQIKITQYLTALTIVRAKKERVSAMCHIVTPSLLTTFADRI